MLAICKVFKKPTLSLNYNIKYTSNYQGNVYYRFNNNVIGVEYTKSVILTILLTMKSWV